jgi:outer membrane assembly lipoprotein YfiO
MRQKIVFIFLLFFLFSSHHAYSYWIWTPKSGKWVNPKNEPKGNPKDQFDYAKSLLDGKKYEDARKEFKKLLKAYPKSFEASEGQYYLGVIEEALGNLYEAYLAYQKVIDVYPFSERIQQLIEKEYKIAEAFMRGEKRKALGLVLPVENPAIEIYQKVIDNSTYGPLAPKAQYQLGLVLKSLQRYFEAEEAFNKVLTNYPESEWREPAQFQIAVCRQAVSRSADYDQGSMQEAKDKFQQFVNEHPDAVLSKEAEKSIDQLIDKEAEANFNVARFYEKQNNPQSAKIYYNEIIAKAPESTWAAQALVRLQVIEKKGAKKTEKKK